MQIADKNTAQEKIDSGRDGVLENNLLLTRPLPEWLNTTNFLWLVSSLFALGAVFYLSLARPVLQQTWQADDLMKAVEQKHDYRIYGTETDPAGQRFAWVAPKDALLIAPSGTHTGRTVTVRIWARGASAAGGPANSTQVTANGVALGEIKPVAGSADFQEFKFTFVPAYRDDHRIYLNFNTPAWKPAGEPRELGFMLQAYSVDVQEVWSPLFREGRTWLIWLLALLAGLTLAVKTVQRFAGRQIWLGWLGTALALATAGWAALWLWLLNRVGWNGELNHDFYWLSVAAAFYLLLFFSWLALAGFSWGTTGENNLLEKVTRSTRNWRERHPNLTALAAITAFNLALTVVFVGKTILETGDIGLIFRYLDGPEYVVIANNFYDLKEPLLRISDFGAHSKFYWGAHFPGFSVLLMLLKPLFGWIWSPLIGNFLASTGFAFYFYKLVREFKYAEHPLWLALVALVLPVRWLIYHNVGGSEALFMFFEVLAIYWFKKDKYWLAGLAGFGAIFTRPPGLFLWAGFMAFLAFEALVKVWNEQGKLTLPPLLRAFRWRAFAGLLLIPLGVTAVFGIYWWRYGDFWAYFRIEENVTHVGFIPFPTLLNGGFNSPALIILYILQAVGLVLLWRQARFDIFWLALTSFFYTIFLMHSDVLRYSIPFFALIVLIPMAKYFSGKTARWLAVPTLLALFFYSWGVLDGNLAVLETYEQMKQILGIR